MRAVNKLAVRNKRAASFALLAILSIASTPAFATTTTYANSNDGGSICCFGYPDTTTYGQTFTAPGGSLLNWTFYDTDSTDNGAKLVIAQWGGSDVIGGQLFGSLVQTVTSESGASAHEYSGINLSLTAGTTYIAYLTVADVNTAVQAHPDQSEVSFNGSLGSPLFGLFMYRNSNSQDALNNVWLPGGNDAPAPNLQYTANFASTPLPSTWLMLLGGLAGLGFFAYRGTKKNTAAIAAA